MRFEDQGELYQGWKTMCLNMLMLLFSNYLTELDYNLQNAIKTTIVYSRLIFQ